MGGDRWRLGDAALVVLAALALRLVFIEARSLWFDETFTVFVARLPWRDALKFIAQSDPHPPLYYLAMHFWLRLVESSPMMVRLPSVVCGSLAAGVATVCAAEIGGRKVGIAAGALVAASGLAVQASVEARMYPLLGLLTLISTFALWRACEAHGTWVNWAVYAVTTSLGLYTDYFAFLVLPVHCTYVIFFCRKKEAQRQGFVVALGAALALYAPWWPVLVEQYGTGRFYTIWKGPMPPSAPVNMLGVAAFGGYVLRFDGYLAQVPQWTWVQVLAVLPVAALAAYGAVSMGKTSTAVLVVLSWTLPVASLIVVSVVTGVDYAISRYTSFVYPFFAILLARAAVSLSGFAVPRRVSARTLIGAVLVVVLAAVNVAVLAYARQDPKFRVYDWAGAARYVRDRWREEDGAVFYPAPGRVAFAYYFDKPFKTIVTLAAPSWKLRLSKGEWARFLPPLSERLDAVPRVWLVLTHPTPQGTAAAVAGELERRYVRAAAADFGGVTVLLYEARGLQD